MTLSIDDILELIHDLPSLPEVVIDIINSIDHEDMNVAQLTRKISLDQSLTAKILRRANSSYYNTRSNVTTVQQAINLIGFSGVRNLIVAMAFKGSFHATACQGFDFSVFWRHSIATAVCAKALARHLQLNQDYAYTAGLLHDIGRLVLVTYFTRQYEQAIAWRAEHDCHILQAEREVIGVDHAIVGEALAKHWKFSKGMQNAIARHHVPDVTSEDALSAIVHVADAIAHALDLSGDEEDLVPPVSSVVWNTLELGEQAWLRIFRETELGFEAAKMGLLA